jgi:hypothetical protein
MFLVVALKEARRVPLTKSMSTLRYGAMRRLQFDRKKICMGSVIGLPGYTSDFSPACCSMVWDRDVSRLTGPTRDLLFLLADGLPKGHGGQSTRQTQGNYRVSSIVLSGCIVSLDCKDASQLTDCQCIGSQGKMIDLNLTISISSDDGLSLLLLKVSTPNLSRPTCWLFFL